MADDESVEDLGCELRGREDVVDLGAAETDTGGIEDPITRREVVSLGVLVMV